LLSLNLQSISIYVQSWSLIALSIVIVLDYIVRIVSPTNIGSMDDDEVSDTVWDTIINDDDTTNNVCINFTDKFLTISKESIPLKTILVRHNDKPWISS
jgi:hypothetical protein